MNRSLELINIVLFTSTTVFNSPTTFYVHVMYLPCPPRLQNKFILNCIHSYGGCHTPETRETSVNYISNEPRVTTLLIEESKRHDSLCWIVGVVVLTSRDHIDENIDEILRNYFKIRRASLVARWVTSVTLRQHTRSR